MYLRCQEDAAGVGNDAGEHHEGGDADTSVGSTPSEGDLLRQLGELERPSALSWTQLVGGDELRELVHRSMSLNAPHHHHLILRAFAEIWEEVFSGYDWSCAPPPGLELRLDLVSTDQEPPPKIRPPEEEKIAS